MNRAVWSSLLFVALGVTGVTLVQPGLAANVHKVHQRDDAFFLPPPAQLRAMSLGYHAAATDLLWEKIVLESGTHWMEKRPFHDVTRYVDAIIGMEPDFANIYLYVDTLVLFIYGGAGDEEAHAVRKYLERGTRERPYDPEIWLHYGQYVAFFAPSFLKDQDEVERWRKDGAFALMHAVELGADPDRSLAASTILSKSGERDWAVKHEEALYALTDDAETRRQILGKITMLKGSFEAALAVDAVEHEWRVHWPFLSRGEALLIGPPGAPERCAGPTSYARAECARDWNGFVGAAR